MYSCAGQLPIVWGYAGPVGVATLVFMGSATDQGCRGGVAYKIAEHIGLSFIPVNRIINNDG